MSIDEVSLRLGNLEKGQEQIIERMDRMLDSMEATKNTADSAHRRLDRMSSTVTGLIAGAGVALTAMGAQMTGILKFFI